MRRNTNFLLCSLLIIFFVKCQKQTLKTLNITEGVYNLITKKKLSCLTYIGGLKTSREKYGSNRLNFRISEIKGNLNKENRNIIIDKEQNSDNKYFNIFHMSSSNYIGVKGDANSKYSIVATYKMFEKVFITYEWNFIKIEENTFLIKNKAGCYLKEERNNIICTEKINPFNYFHLLKLYSEVSISKKDELILEKEPIDVLIKYIDLNDTNLVREGLHQIKKDVDNEELRYSIRSILTNIPWVRKIFIVMPNEKVRYFKDYEQINEKIVYVKDKDLLGYDSANSHAFQYRFWKMKQFGLSDNFIYMDDDCFIGKPLNKSNFFYVENNKVVPAIINTKFEVHTELSDSREYEKLKKKINNNEREQTSDKFMYTVYKTYLFLIKYFQSPIIVPYFTHNAIPANVDDIKEIYDLVYNSEYRNSTLDSKYRHIESLQFQTSLNVYIFNKYKRKSNMINNNYIDNGNSIYGKFNYPLFCINTGNNKDYSPISFTKTKIVMEKLFPIPTKYEIFDYKIVPNSAFEAMKVLEKELSELKKIKEKHEVDKEKYENDKISIEYEKCINKVDMYISENAAYTSKIRKRDVELKNCKKNLEKSEKKQNELKIGNTNYLMREKIREELSRVVENNNNYLKKIEEYKKENDEYLRRISSLKSKDKRLYFFIWFQLILIIIIVLIIGIYYPLKKKLNEKNEVNEINQNGFNMGSNFKRITKEENDEKLKLFDEN